MIDDREKVQRTTATNSWPAGAARRTIPAPRAPRPATPPRSASASFQAGRPRLAGEPGLIERVYERCQRYLDAACRMSSVPVEFLAALTANESGGNLDVCRFEPAVYQHLKALASGQAPAYGALRASELERDVEDMLHPKAPEFHARYLTAPFGANHAPELAAVADDLLRELSTSWGFTQIMGYHLAGRPGGASRVRDLLDPHLHYRIAIELLAEFADDYKLDLGREFAELFCCWNTGRPCGKTFDPKYVENGLRRMALYHGRLTRDAGSAAPLNAER